MPFHDERGYHLIVLIGMRVKKSYVEHTLNIV